MADEREHDDAVPRDIAKLWGFARESIAHIEGELSRIIDALFGRHGDNGINGTTKLLVRRMDAVEAEVREAKAWGLRVWEVERHKPGACIGKAALDAHIASATRQSEELRKARLTLIGSLGVAALSVVSAVAVAVINKAPAPAAAYADIDRRLGVIEAAIMRSTRSYPDPATLKPLEEPAN